MNTLYFGDCLDVLKELNKENPKGFIDLIYIDPPFNSKRDYNILFENIDMKDSTAQKQAFADTWSNVSYYDSLSEIQDISLDIYSFLVALDKINISKSAVAYLTTMAIRIFYMHKVLKETGSFYLHCDPTMSHYLKLLCDIIFGERNFRNEITWRRSFAHGDTGQGAKHFGRVTDSILFYIVSENAIWNAQYEKYTELALERDYKYIDDKTKRRYRLAPVDGPGGASKGNPFYEFLGVSGYWRFSKERMQRMYEEGKIVISKKGGSLSQKIYLDESKGRPVDNLWDNINRISPNSKERLGYPTQKPEALLERIIKASSNEGDLVADFFCGCGTTVAVAQKLNRKWIGSDISHLAIKLVMQRLIDPYSKNQEKQNEIRNNIIIKGLPKDIGSAKELAQNTEKGRFGFQDWIIEIMIGGVVNPKKTADGGWDGHITFEVNDGKHTCLIEVKSGNVNVKNLREFIQVIDKQNARIGVFVCFEEYVTKPMIQEAKQQGYYDKGKWGTRYDKIQILTVEDLLNGKQVQMPVSTKTTFKKSSKMLEREDEQQGIF